MRSGNIYQISLPQGLGFACLKCINLLEINRDARYSTLVRIYNYRSQSPIEFDEIISGKELILSPLLISGILPAIKNGHWNLIGYESPKAEELIIPDYKEGEPEEDPIQWYSVSEADISKKLKTDYKNVKHLENIGATGSELVGVKIAMALLQDEGIEIKEYFSLDEYYVQRYYREVTGIPSYYSQPKHMRGKALAEI